MKRVFLKIVVLAVVFIGSVYVFSIYLNREEIKTTTAVADPSLPVLMIRYGNTDINSMFGYADEMDERTLRRSVTLLPYDRNLTLSVAPYNNDIENISYRVSSLEDLSQIENGAIKMLSRDSGRLVADLHLDEPVTMGQEYMLRFDVNLKDGRTFYYYTRIVQRNGQNLEWYLDYAQAWYSNCLQNNITEEMIAQLEPETSESNSSLHYVNIPSGIEQLAWGSLSPSLYRKAIPTVLEINETTVSLELDYIVTANDEQNNTEYYSVSEFYRMRKNQDFVVLLDYERTAEQYFNGELPVLTQSGISLGIAGKDVKYRIDSAADTAAFVQNGEIWVYNRDANKASRAFSFITDRPGDERCENKEFGATISSVSDKGIVTFIVYGHMNTGVHEGRNGICLYRYDQNENTTKELLFIPSEIGYEVLNRSLSRLAFVNELNQCFLCYGDSIVSVSPETLTTLFIEKALDWDTFSVSDSQTLVGWTEKDEVYAAASELNLNTGDTLKIEAPEGELISTLGFIGEDLIYGLSRPEDECTDEAGNTFIPMYRVCLMNDKGEVVKDYTYDNIFISSVERDGSLLVLKRFAKEGGERKELPDDNISYYEIEREENVMLRLSVSERKGTEVHMDFSIPGKTSNLLTLYTRYLSVPEIPQTALAKPEQSDKIFYVYSRGSLEGIYSKVNLAIEAADRGVGTVLNELQQYVWERGNYKESVMLDISHLPKALLDAPLGDRNMEKAVGEDRDVWNLSECSLSSMKYQISCGYPVCAKWTDDSSVLITGYDQFNIWIYDKAAGEPKAVAFEDAEAACEAAGNIFYSYH